MKAFPSKENVVLANTFAIYGMDLRDYFAAKAMNGFIKRYYPHEILEKEYTEDIYKASYVIADAMMKAREK